MFEKIYKSVSIKPVSVTHAFLIAFLIVLGGCGGTSGNIPVVPLLKSIAITPASPNIAPGATQKLTSTGTYSDGSTADITASVTWTPNTPAIATINSAGLATGITAGWSRFTASLGGISGSTVIPVLTVEVEPNNTLAAATPMTPTVTMTGQLSSITDLDYYQVTATGSGAISVAITAKAQLSVSAGWTISILDPAGKTLSSASCTTCSKPLNAGISAAGTYYVLVQADTVTYSTFPNSTDNYTLTATVP